MLSSFANMFHTSIVTTLYHSQILIWIRLCHVRGLRKWGFFFFFFFLYSPLTHFRSPSPCHSSMLPPYRPFDVPALIWSLMESVALLCLSVAGSEIPGFIAACLHSGEWVSRLPWNNGGGSVALGDARHFQCRSQSMGRPVGLLPMCFAWGNAICGAAIQTTVDLAKQSKAYSHNNNSIPHCSTVHAIYL